MPGQAREPRVVANRCHGSPRSSVIENFVRTPSEVDPINVQTMHEKGQRIESLHMRARRVMMQKNRGSRISNEPGQKRLVIDCLLGAVSGFFVWLRVQACWLLAVGILFAAAGIGCFAMDWLVATDREYPLALFPKLARAAEKQDTATIMADLDPDLRPLREEAERALKQVRPSKVVVPPLRRSLT